jgi:putative resolvase
MRVSVAAHQLGLHPCTVRRWIKTGKIRALQVGNESRILPEEIARLMGVERKRVIVLYGRVSGHDQQADLQTQMEPLAAWARSERAEKEVVELSDICSGLKARRKNLLKILALIQADKVEEVVVTHADRLSRFGLEYLTMLFEGFKVRSTVLHPDQEKTPEQELTDDLIAFVAFLPGRVYRLQGRKKRDLAARIKQTLNVS